MDRETFDRDILDDNKEKTRDLSIVLTKFEIISSSRKKRKSSRKKVKGENFGSEVEFMIYDVEKIKEDGKEG